MKKLLSFTAVGFLLLALCAAVAPAWAADVDQRIRTLEEELARLKSEQAEVKAEQIEFKKNALAAEGALPTFSFRAGNGLLIEAADKSWSLRTSMEAHMRINFESGLSHAGRTNGEVMGRRFRTRWNYCVENCFYEIETSLDLDGFATNSGLQRGVIWVHLENISPWLPTMYFGMDGPAAISDSRQGSSATGSQMDYDLLSRNNGFNTGRFGNGIGFNWDDKPLAGIGIPGRIKRLNLVSATIGEGDDGASSNKDIGGNFDAYIGVQPFSELKSKWIQGLMFEVGAWFCRVDTGTTDQGGGQSACRRLRIRDNGDGGRQTLFDTGNAIGRGWTHFIMPGITWEIGPYRIRAAGGFQQYDENGRRSGASPLVGKTVGNMFLIGHDLFIWSPKGFLTGSSATPGSVMFGTHFERDSVDCNAGGGKTAFTNGPSCGANQNTAGFSGFNRNTILVREWDMWYFLAARASIGVSWVWYDAKNLTETARHNLGLGSLNPTFANREDTKGGNWWDFNLNFRYVF